MGEEVYFLVYSLGIRDRVGWLYTGDIRHITLLARRSYADTPDVDWSGCHGEGTPTANGLKIATIAGWQSSLCLIECRNRRRAR